MNSTESNSLPFPVKLKRIVDLPETDHLIYWDEDGLSFHIADQNQFAHDVIPLYFKHNNISSFIRQLNMYGFHKINRIENGLAVIGNGNEDSQWSHPQFIRDKPELVQNITRKVTNPFSNSLVSRKISNNIENDMSYESVKNDIATLVKAVQQLKQRDEETTDKLKSLTDENNHLYTTLMYLREEHEKQSKLIDILIKFFSIYANNPQENRLKPKRVLALELPQSQSSPGNFIEPPTKYFVASPDSNYPQVSVTNNSSNNSSNNFFKGKKLIKITNVHTPQIDIKTPKSVLNNNNITINSNNNKYCNISTMNTLKTQNPGRLLINIPKSTNNNVQPNRAITIFQSNTNHNTPTIVIPSRKITQQTPIQINAHKGTININKIAKSVTVSSMDEDPISDNTHYINSPNQSNTNSFAFNNKNVNNDANFFNVDEYLNSQIFNKNLITRSNPKIKTKAEMDSVISDITANVSSMGKSLNQIKKCLTTENSYPTNTVTQSNISDLNFDIDVDDSGTFVSNNIINNNCNNNDDEMAYEELKTLWENIRNDNLYEDFPNSDSSRIQGHELIPFNTHEPVYNYQDNYIIDDLLQTPEIHPEESSLSLNGLKDSLCPTDDFFNDYRNS